MAVCGSSFSLPSGVEIEDAYHSVLEERLGAELGRDIEFLNFSVGSFNTLQILAMLRLRAIDYEPDLVLFTVTRLSAPNLYSPTRLRARFSGIPSRTHSFWNSFLVRLVQNRRGAIPVPTPAPMGPGERKDSSPNVIEKLGEFSRTFDIPVVVVLLEFDTKQPQIDPILPRDVRANGLHWLDTRTPSKEPVPATSGSTSSTRIRTPAPTRSLPTRSRRSCGPRDWCRSDAMPVRRATRARGAMTGRGLGCDLMGERGRTGFVALAIALAVAGAQGCRDVEVTPFPSRPDVAERPNVLLVTLDTTRADRLGLYGYTEDTSPHLDRLGEESVVYTRAVSTSSWTLPAHASLFTGKLPTSHGARFDAEGPLVIGEAIQGPDVLEEFRATPLAKAERTLAARLGEHGYTTGGVVGGPWMKRVFGLGKGFDVYSDAKIDTLAGASATVVSDAAVAFIDANGAAPFFLFLNYYDPHGPYQAPLRHRLATDWGLLWPDADPSQELLAAGYDAELRYADEELGRVLDRLRARGLYEDMLIVVTSDHGELFGEHGRFSHGYFLTEPELHVPLVVKWPRAERRAARDATRVSTAGVFAMILERAGIQAPSDVAPPPAGSSGTAVAETYPHPRFAPEGHWRAIYRGSFKYLWNSKGDHLLFDLANDAGENDNLVNRLPAVAKSLDATLSEILSNAPRTERSDEPVREVDAETRRALENLGYLE